jgi:hypothetical protein
MRFFDALMCAGLLLLAGFVVRLDVQDARAVNKLTGVTSGQQLARVALQSLAGFGPGGKPVRHLPADAKQIAFFVIHGSAFETDLTFWNQARAMLPDTSLEFAGVCDDAFCVQQVTASPEKLNFTAVTMGDYYAMRWLMNAGARGKLMLLDRASGKTREVPLPRSPENLKSSLLEGK